MITSLIRTLVLVGVILANLLGHHHSCANPSIPTGREGEREWQSDVTGNKRDVFRRERRYVTFPEGSTLSVVWCLTTSTPTMDNIMTFSTGLGLAYDLPNETKALNGDEFEGQPYDTHSATEDKAQNEHQRPNYIDHEHHKYEYVITQRRRDRRDIYQRMELAIASMGLPGRSCLLRALCEANSRLSSSGVFLEELLKVIFTIPQLKRRKRINMEESSKEEWYNLLDGDQDIYDKAFLLGVRDKNPDCELYFPYCEVSIWKILLPR